MIVSVSSDGQYVISSHRGNEIVLWDIAQQSNRLVSNNGNIYSAYFIKNTDMFIWQDLENVVYLQKVNGEKIKSFKHLPTYGHVMTSDLQHYFSSDVDWGIYHGSGDDLVTMKKGDGGGFLGGGKLMNLTLPENNTYLTMSGYSYRMDDRKRTPKEEKQKNLNEMMGVTLWDVSTLKSIAKLPGNAAQTNATISPDGKYVVSGCANRMGFVWQTNNVAAKPMRLSSLAYGVWLGMDQWDDSEIIPVPRDFDQSHHGPYMAMKFIAGSKTYLGFLTSEPYALLYDIESPFHKKWLPLGRTPFPSVNNYTRNASIDTAPAVGILVTGQHAGGGINVYKYHPEKQELEKVWVAE